MPHKADFSERLPPRGPHPLAHYLNAIAGKAGESGNGPERLALFLKGVRAYQDHPYRRTMDEPPMLAQYGSARLLAFAQNGMPVVFVPSLINPSWVLDLTPQNSLLRWLADQGVAACLVDWGTPVDEELNFDLNDFITRRLMPLLHQVGRPVILVGYCLGGTLSLAASALIPQSIHALATLAAPWTFSGYTSAQRSNVAVFWRNVRPVCDALGVLPMEILQLAFWSLDPDLVEQKYAKFAQMEMESDEARSFVALEDWANQGPPLSLPAASQCFDPFFAQDLPGQSRWQIEERFIDPAHVACPTLVVTSTKDRLVPEAVAAPLAAQLSHSTILQVEAGHVGMVTGSRAQSLLWEPLLSWLRSVQ